MGDNDAKRNTDAWVTDKPKLAAPPVVAPLEHLLPVGITEEDLVIYQKNRANILEKLELALLVEAADPSVRRQMVARRGLTDAKLLDEMKRLERGQATQNINIHVYDSKIAELRAEILRMEQEDAERSRAQLEEGSSETQGLE